MFNSPKSEPSKSAYDSGSAESEDIKSLAYAEKLKNLSSIFKSHEFIEIYVGRRRIWEDSVQKLKRLFKDEIKPFHICFVGDEAVDHGCPFKEYFTLLFDEVKHRFFCTYGNLGFSFLHDIQKLQNGEFYLFGLLCFIGILKGCTAPRCFLSSVVEKIFLGTSTKQLSIEEIPDFDIQLKLQTIPDVKTEDVSQNIVDTFPERFGFGFTKFAISSIEKSELIHQITQHFCFSNGSEEIQDFKRGLEQYRLYSILSERFAHASKEFHFHKKSLNSFKQFYIVMHLLMILKRKI